MTPQLASRICGITGTGQWALLPLSSGRGGGCFLSALGASGFRTEKRSILTELICCCFFRYYTEDRAALDTVDKTTT